MKKFSPSRILLLCLFFVAAVAARADEEQTQIDILKSDAGIPQKYQACQKLRVIGTVKAVAGVAPLLTDPILSQAARQTLDGLPYPEVDNVLRDALGKTTGAVQAGIIDSIGWREKPESVPLLVPLLSDADTNVATAAANSLGRIGGQDAITALVAARDTGPASVQGAVQNSLLQCAERLTDNNDASAANAIYKDLFADKYPLGIRTAAWRGLVLTDDAHNSEIMESALMGQDQPLRKVALKVLRDSTNAPLISACLKSWISLPPDAQLALFDAAIKQSDLAQSAVQAAMRSEVAALRTAAWKSIGELNDAQYLLPLANAAATGKHAERDAARESLAQLHGPDVSATFLAALGDAPAPEKVELLRALGTRQDTNATDVLLKNAAAGDQPVRLAALASLKLIAAPPALVPLLDIAQKADSDEVRDAAMDALSAVCQATPDKDAATHSILDVESHVPAAQQLAFQPLWPLLGTPDALTAAETASHGDNLDLAKEAVRALSLWPTSAPAQSLMDLAHTASDVPLHTLALRGAISVSAQEPDAAKRLAFLKQAMSETRRPEEKKDVLSQLGQLAAPEALDLALTEMDDAAVSNEASLAALSIAEKLAKSNPDLAQKTSAKVLQQHTEGELFLRAWSLRAKSTNNNAPFLRDWVVCGPFRKSGVTGAIEIFKVPLGPEVKKLKVKWKPAPSGNEVNLAALFPGAENCAAFLRTTITVPDDCSGVLLMGSDDGIKAWLNGAVIHSHNVDRPQVADDDAAPVHLKKGSNELILKISQGGGGWGACARIVGLDGNPIAGLQAERPTTAAGSLTQAE